VLLLKDTSILNNAVQKKNIELSNWSQLLLPAPSLLQGGLSLYLVWKNAKMSSLYLNIEELRRMRP
jgi:hypothetical protein